MKPNLTLFNLPPELTIKILYYTSIKDHGRLAEVSTKMELLANDFSLWNDLLKPEFKNAEYGKAKQIFLTQPEARAKFIAFDSRGFLYLNKLIDQRIAEGSVGVGQKEHLSLEQRKHLGSKIVRNLIATEKLTIEEAILRSAPNELNGLSYWQLEGIKVGLTREQLDGDWFSGNHKKAAKEGMPLENYHGLNDEEVEGLLSGLKREQIIGLTCTQIEGIKLGLSREQVKHD